MDGIVVILLGIGFVLAGIILLISGVIYRVSAGKRIRQELRQDYSELN